MALNPNVNQVYQRTVFLANLLPDSEECRPIPCVRNRGRLESAGKEILRAGEDHEMEMHPQVSLYRGAVAVILCAITSGNNASGQMLPRNLQTWKLEYTGRVASPGLIGTAF